MLADDLMAACFPDAAACLENIPGDRQIPDHPLVNQTVRDCLEEAMDFAALAAILARIHAGEIRCIARDTTEPSPLCHEILNARPYAFMDDAPLEERRTQAVYARRAGEPARAGDLGALDPAAIDRVRDEARPDPRDADELHDALVTAGFLTEDDAARSPRGFFDELTARAAGGHRHRPVAGRDGRQSPAIVWIAAERMPEWRAIHPGCVLDPPIDGAAVARGASMDARGGDRRAAARPPRDRRTDDRRGAGARRSRSASRRRGARFSRSKPTASRCAAPFAIPPEPQIEWCDRRLLARIHRYTLNRLRAEIEPVSPADFMRFLFAWQHVDAVSTADRHRRAARRRRGARRLRARRRRVGAAVLPARVDGYEPSLLDTLCADRRSRLGAPLAVARRRRRWSARRRWRCSCASTRMPGIALRPRRRRRPRRWQTASSDAREAVLVDALRTRGASFLARTGVGL